MFGKRVALLATCAAAVVVFPAPAAAAKPTPGARYYGLPAAGQYRADGLADVTVRLGVSNSGRRIVAAGLLLRCQHRTRQFDLKSVQMNLSFRDDPRAVIRRDGSFAIAGRGGGRRYRLAGRFVTGQYARLFYRARMLLPRAIDRRRYQTCRHDVSSPAALYRGGIPPFSGCRSQRARTLASTDTGRVLQQYTLSRPRGGWFPHAYACLFATPMERVDLGQNYDDETVEVPRIAGTLVAYSAGVTTIAGAFAELRILDLSGATVERTVDATPGPPDGVNRVLDLVLKPNGAIAWMVGRGSYDPAFPSFQQQLWALDAAGQRLLDTGPNLDLTSLDLNDSTLTWANGGFGRSAVLN